MGPAKVTIFGLYNQKGWIQKVHTDFEYFDVLYFVGTSKLLYVVVVFFFRWSDLSRWGLPVPGLPCQ